MLFKRPCYIRKKCIDYTDEESVLRVKEPINILFSHLNSIACKFSMRNSLC